MMSQLAALVAFTNMVSSMEVYITTKYYKISTVTSIYGIDKL